MELHLLGALLVLALVYTIDLRITVTFVVTLWYGQYYWSGDERHYRPALLWNRSRMTLWPILSSLFRHTIDSGSVPLGPVLYACRPHGIFALSSWLTFLSGTMDTETAKVLLAVHSVFFKIPLVSDVLLGLGCIDAGYDSIRHALQWGFSVAVIPGGVKEMGPPLIPVPDDLGVLRMAHALKVPLVAVHFGGEEDLCWVWHGEWAWVRWLRRTSYAWMGLFVPLFFMPRFWAGRPRLRTTMRTLHELPLDALKVKYKETQKEMDVRETNGSGFFASFWATKKH